MSKAPKEQKPQSNSDGFEYLIFGIMFLYAFNTFSLALLYVKHTPAGYFLLFNIVLLGACLYRARHILKNAKTPPSTSTPQSNKETKV